MANTQHRADGNARYCIARNKEQAYAFVDAIFDSGPYGDPPEVLFAAADLKDKIGTSKNGRSVMIAMSANGRPARLVEPDNSGKIMITRDESWDFKIIKRSPEYLKAQGLL